MRRMSSDELMDLVAKGAKPCSKCRGSMFFARTDRGAMMPLDAEPVVEGPMVLVQEPHPHTGELQVLARHVSKVDAPMELRWMPHHATCPDADSFR